MYICVYAKTKLLCWTVYNAILSYGWMLISVLSKEEKKTQNEMNMKTKRVSKKINNIS